MHISDIALECSQRCTQLASKCTDEEIAIELSVLAVKLMVAVVRDAELLVDSSPRSGTEGEQACFSGEDSCQKQVCTSST
jgi:hypothetical protein